MKWTRTWIAKRQLMGADTWDKLPQRLLGACQLRVSRYRESFWESFRPRRRDKTVHPHLSEDWAVKDSVQKLDLKASSSLLVLQKL